MLHIKTTKKLYKSTFYLLTLLIKQYKLVLTKGGDALKV